MVADETAMWSLVAALVLTVVCWCLTVCYFLKFGFNRLKMFRKSVVLSLYRC